MGDPKRQKKKYQRPGHPWQGARISNERLLLREYGLKNKKELWRATSLLRNWRAQARAMNSLPKAEKDKTQKALITKLYNLELVVKTAHLDDILALQIKDLLERRLQTLIYKQGLANTVKQARQFIVHNKIMVNGKSNSSPAQMLKTSDKVSFVHGFEPILQKVVKTKGTTQVATPEVPKLAEDIAITEKNLPEGKK